MPTPISSLEMSDEAKIIKALLKCDVDYISEIINQPGGCRFAAYSFSRLTLCINYIFQDPDTWGKDADKARVILAANTKMMEFWESRIDLNAVAEMLDDDFHDFSLDDMADTESEVLCISESELAELKMIARQIDIDLFCATNKHDIKGIIRLLSNGADPEAYDHIYNEYDEYISIDSMGYVVEYMSDIYDEMSPFYYDFFFNDKPIKENISSFIYGFMHLASLCRMWFLLKEHQ